MATSKTLTAEDLHLGKLVLHRVGANVNVERRYLFVDATDTVIVEWQGGRVVQSIAVADIPQNILDALQTIDTWTYDLALAQEGMT